MARSEITDAFELQRGMLRITGVWPEEHASVLYIVKHIICWILAIALCVTMSMECIYDINDFAKVSEILYVTVTVTVYVVKLFCMTYHRKAFIDIVNLLKTPIFTSYPDDIDHYMAKTIKLVRFLANTYRYLCLCCMLLYAVYPFVDNKQLPFPFPYDVGKYRFLMFAFQIISSYSASWNISTIDMLQVSLMGIGAAELDILAAKIQLALKNSTDINSNDETIEENNRKVDQNLKECVEHHLTIITFIEGLEKIFSLAILAQFIGSTFVICNTVFYFLLLSKASTMFIILTDYLVVMLIELFMFCWFGNEIMVKSLKIIDACYMSDWHNHNNQVRKYLFIIMERSRRPLTVTVFSISSLSLDAFKSIMQWSYSCFALLLNLYYSEPS